MPIEEPKPYDEDLDNADMLAADAAPVEGLATGYIAQAQAYALISIARTLRRLELLQPKLRY